MRTRLAAMMFLQYAVQGLWAVPLAAFLMASPHEGGLNMPAGRVALIYATMSIGALVSPLLLGLICDRLVAVQRMLAGLHFVGAGLLAAMLVWGVRCEKDVQDAFDEIADRFGVQFTYGEGHNCTGTLAGWLDNASFMRFLSVGDAENKRQLEHQARIEDWLGYLHIHVETPRHLQRFKSNGSTNWQYNSDDLSRQSEQIHSAIQPAIQQVRQNPAVVAAADRAFRPLFGLMLAYACVYLPTISLSNVVAFRNLPDPGRQYGAVRALGTLGWIAAGLFVGFAAPAVSPLCFLFAAVASGILAVLCVFLPNTPPVAFAPRSSRRISDRFGLPALKMLTDRSFFVYVLTAVVATALIAFHNIYTNKFLVDLHVDHPAAVQTLAQPTEILGAMLIPWVWARLGTKWMLCLGLVASAARFAMYATASPPEVIGLGLPLHGLGFAFFYIAAYLYVDCEAPPDLRASAQGLVTLLTLGVGGLLGNWFAGQVVEAYTTAGTVDWRPVWLVPAIGTLAAAVLFATLFTDRHSSRDAYLAPGQ
jgi:nucleoside transporter